MTIKEFLKSHRAQEISERCWQGKQSWEYELIARAQTAGAPIKLKVAIHRDFYDFQSHARVYKWDNDKWHLVNELSIGECACQEVSSVDRDVQPQQFHADVEKLLTTALEIVR